MPADDIKQTIRALLKDRNALLLAHNYMRDEVQEIADITGDSLGLSQEAARTDADVIVFCGVHFMAESAAILSPGKTVLLPRLDAGCPMADMVTVEPRCAHARRGGCRACRRSPGRAVGRAGTDPRSAAGMSRTTAWCGRWSRASPRG